MIRILYSWFVGFIGTLKQNIEESVYIAQHWAFKLILIVAFPNIKFPTLHRALLFKLYLMNHVFR